jgi:hypothetical protein
MRHNTGWGCSSEVEGLHSMCKPLGWISQQHTEKRKEEGGKKRKQDKTRRKEK